MRESRLGLVAEAKEGECPFCEEPAKKRSMKLHAVVKRKQRGSSDWNLTCGARACSVTAYTSYYKRTVRARNKARKGHMSVPQSRTSP